MTGIETVSLIKLRWVRPEHS